MKLLFQIKQLGQQQNIKMAASLDTNRSEIFTSSGQVSEPLINTAVSLLLFIIGSYFVIMDYTPEISFKMSHHVSV